jgi:uncharacterized RmlC-like cupin family protein
MGEERVRVVRVGDRGAPTPTTPGMFRQEVAATDRAWVGTVVTEPGVITGWHHHGDHESYIYVLSGAIRLEFGPGGREAEEAGPGDFVIIPSHLVHREGTTEGSSGVEGVVFRAGSGPVVVNVEGPDPD